MAFNTTAAKSIASSKTFWAAVVMILAVFSPKIYGIIFGTGADQTTAVASIVQYIGLIGGFVGVVAGRIAAKTTVTLTGAPPAAK